MNKRGNGLGRTRATSDNVGLYNRQRWFADFIWYMEHNGYKVKVKKING